ncbi:MAG: 23S rRNA pseudouridine synthase F [Candidatus Komeilibacteria bacterium CG10_big_fil_rev_8_21_14_0_10_41_13]|uniref:Pseudouridine synthase n=1 Tax=Candidatus Komeilibacteria bacterium CG10_big_fil_rev_8_21_14_0_10_41_13 TaxID=1974476 RepID=A0A2M6WCY8_9BACT|nr:MAG: 23S rRNA pseudouridine synthase F [Candidatus Komeilibacteria bacterium CG10_big_fil_rev_8_21_14_0_10_41_13]
MRINKFITQAGVCSRRQADQLIKEGRVLINNQKASLGDQVAESDQVKVSGKIIKPVSQKIYLAYHKPVGVICTTDLSKKDNIIERVQVRERVFPVGRLDVESSGLILLTNDGDWANKLMHPKFEHQKEYLVTVDKALAAEYLEKLKRGVRLAEGLAKADQIKKIGEKDFLITIHQGWNRQIRRMAEKAGFNVVALKRVRIGKFKLGSLRPDEWKYLEIITKS